MNLKKGNVSQHMFPLSVLGAKKDFPNVEVISTTWIVKRRRGWGACRYKSPTNVAGNLKAKGFSLVFPKFKFQRGESWRSFPFR